MLNCFKHFEIGIRHEGVPQDAYYRIYSAMCIAFIVTFSGYTKELCLKTELIFCILLGVCKYCNTYTGLHKII